MFPLRDNIPSRHRPYAMWTLLALNIAVFLGCLGLGPAQEFKLFHLFGVVPARFFNPEWAMFQGYPEGLLLPLGTLAAGESATVTRDAPFPKAYRQAARTTAGLVQDRAGLRGATRLGLTSTRAPRAGRHPDASSTAPTAASTARRS